MSYLSALEVCSRQGAIQIHVYLTTCKNKITRHSIRQIRSEMRLTDERSVVILKLHGVRMQSRVRYLVSRRAVYFLFDTVAVILFCLDFNV